MILAIEERGAEDVAPRTLQNTQQTLSVRDCIWTRRTETRLPPSALPIFSSSECLQILFAWKYPNYLLC
jgi:hypothetical protein